MEPTLPHPTSPDFGTLVASLRWRAEHEPARVAVRFLSDGEVESSSHTYHSLDTEARKVAAKLQSIVKAGDRVLLCFSPGADFVVGFFGCLYANVIAVPVYPPKNNRSLDRLKSIVADAGASIALTTSDALAKLESNAGSSEDFRAIRWVSIDEIGSEAAERWTDPGVEGRDIAFLQYTSGSTGAPKGVMVAHENLAANIKMMAAMVKANRETVNVSWLPVYHDMGLIGCVLLPIFEGFLAVLMPPMAFLEKPVRWLAAISKYRGSLVSAPNFAYELCVRRVDPVPVGLDLSSLTATCNGAEPIREETMARFAKKFQAAGFRREAFHPCYGLAETTLYVTGSNLSGAAGLCLDKKALEAGRVEVLPEATTASRTIVSCGKPAAGERIAIVNPETLEDRGENGVGEIWVHGPHVTKGYWNQPDTNKEVFRAQLKTVPGKNFLRTGDLGFLKDGTLYVTGRLKDLIIVHGKNYYPQDLELTAEKTHPAIKAGNCVAFGTNGEMSEEVALVMEMERTALKLDFQEITKNLASAVWREHELKLASVWFIRPGQLPKTSSGKLQRRLTSQLVHAGKLEAVYSWDANQTGGAFAAKPSTDTDELSPIVEKLTNWFSKSAEVAKEKIDPSRPLAEYKLDSLIAFELGSQIEEHYGFKVPPGLVSDYPTINAVAGFIASKIHAKAKAG